MLVRIIFAALLCMTSHLASPVRAQDIVGLEDCAQAKGSDKKIGCLQSNVEFLHRLVRKTEAAAQARLREHDARLREEAAKLAAATAKIDGLRAEIERIRSALDHLEKRVPAR